MPEVGYLTLSISGVTSTLEIVSLRGEEGISMPFFFEIEIVTDDDTLDLATIVGGAAQIDMTASTDRPRYVHGIVTRFVYVAKSDESRTTYRAELRPWSWLLTLTSDYRIYMNQTVPVIVTSIFTAAPLSEVSNKLSATYTARDYAVQCGESTFDFVNRLLEEEGIYYFFTHDDGKHTLVLADQPDTHAAIAGPDPLRFRGTVSDAPADDDVIIECRMEAELPSGKITQRDYAFATPKLSLESTLAASPAVTPALELYDYPGGYQDTGGGTTNTKTRLQAAVMNQFTLVGTSTVRSFVAGATFPLTDHPRDAFNQSYLLVRVTYEATQDSYINTFEAIPATIQYRPPRLTARPRIFGTQTAVVVGPSGEEIYTDANARVKVQFWWDRLGKNDDTAGTWIRVVQPWAGTAWGAQFIPRVNDEVVVSFLDGNPDRPIITGSVYNGLQVPPYTLPDNKTQTGIKTNTSPGGGGSNELRFEDKKGSEELYLHAQKDMVTLIENDRTTTVTHADTLTVTNADRAVTVSAGNDSYTVSKGTRTVAVTAGDETHTVGGKRSLTVTGDETHTNSGKFTQTVSGDYSLTVSGNLVIDVSGSVLIKSGTTFDTQSGTAMTAKSGSDLTNQATGTLKNAGATISNEATGELTNKGATVTNNASAQLNNKSGGLQNVEASGILVVKGSLVQIN